MTLKQSYSYSVNFLELNGVDEADFKAFCLVCHLAGIKNSEYEFHKDDEIILGRLAEKLWKLKCGEPLQYVIGKWDFYESEFYVGKGVLIPRPETEELVDLAVRYVKKLDRCVVYDLCAGSGCIGLSIAKACPNAEVYLIEKSSDAFFYLEKNAKNISNAHIICDDINNTDNVLMADIIISNPPYIKTDVVPTLQKEVLNEPVMALDGGEDGLDFYRIINEKWSSLLKKNGVLFLEIGDDQGEAVVNVLSNFDDISVIKDLSGNDRIVKAFSNRKEM
ncbi:MAG: peptide chain release factor N(5)-glutamine methyltransferase [Acetobacter sp.]|nr:peptide chain release factor N(5)-glutamine methyltransferase [Bacteroides sp.]MCM1342024.1 peptide chain release factor N(5)-glutamine methyltransferase [Acetobacter sp.]MCM1434248.1 peptide chain release factor N(5)-glutamine methyltransferase [Clostridiales bacterium]